MKYYFVFLAMIITNVIIINEIDAQSNSTVYNQPNKPSIDDTKKWILEKLNKYSENIHFQDIRLIVGIDLSSTYSNFSYSFWNNELLIITYSSGDFKNTVQIPICECSISKKAYSSFGGIDGNNTNFRFSSSYKKIQENGREAYAFDLNFDFNREQNLESRLIKAFDNLKSYCVKKEQKETF